MIVKIRGKETQFDENLIHSLVDVCEMAYYMMHPKDIRVDAIKDILEKIYPEDHEFWERYKLVKESAAQE